VRSTDRDEIDTGIPCDSVGAETDNDTYQSYQKFVQSVELSDGTFRSLQKSLEDAAEVEDSTGVSDSALKTLRDPLQYDVSYMSDIDEFMKKLESLDKTHYKNVMQHLMMDYGTGLPCNRFAIGNCNEYAISDLIQESGIPCTVHTNAKRYDMHIPQIGTVSIKYSTTGDIKLHNSNNHTNTDMSMHDTLLVTDSEWWFLRTSEIEQLGIPLKDYIKNTGDGLGLKRSILTRLRKENYAHMFEFDIRVDKSTCKNMDINRIIYDSVKAHIKA